MHKLRFSLIFIIGFSIYFCTDAHFFSPLQKQVTLLSHSKALGHFMAYTLTLLPLLATAVLLGKSRNPLISLGLSGNFTSALGFAFVVTLPMLMAYLLKFKLNTNLSVDTLIINTLSAAFFEELIYRGFLFGMLYRFTKLGFLASVFLGALLFGLAHLYQSTHFNELIGIFLFTFLGSVLFSWVYAEWKFNLWTAILLHCLMNLYWLIFNVADNALGNTYANIFRILTILLVVLGTLLYKRWKKLPLEINKASYGLKKNI